MKKYPLHEIEKSVYTYQSVILSDADLKIKLVDENSTYGIKLTNWSDENLIIELPLSTPSLDFKKTYTINFITSHSVFRATVTLNNKVKKENFIFYTATLISTIRQKRQRNYFRLRAELPLVFIVTPDSKHTISELPPPKKSKTVDISAGGLKFVTDTEIVMPAKIYVNFELQETTFNLTGKILPHFDKLEDNLYEYRVAFKNITPEVQDKLEKCILLHQLLVSSKSTQSARRRYN
ncbi:MAG: hypothetical protein ATN35_11665 [Epulopiscium sp. Nele67-Bin004]|nr:MAG: hypothetical protein ATN35_11665 [Epulopiscium sp. Nele67-Bin004]